MYMYIYICIYLSIYRGQHIVVMTAVVIVVIECLSSL